MTRFLRAVAPALAGILILVRVVSVAATTPQNPDTYFHLRFGHEFLTSWAPWSPGQVSDLNSRAWTPTQWLGEILFTAVEQLGGLPGLAVLYGVLLIGLLTLWYVAARRAASPLVAVLLVGLALVAAGPSLSLRPQMFSFALATVTVLCWDRARLTGRVPWILVPLCWVWAMLHGMWILGVLVSLACAIGLVVERRLTRRAFLVPVGMLVVAALTPAGPRLIEAVVVVVSRADLYSEWAAPVFTTSYGIAVLCLLAVAILPPLRKGPAAPYEIAVTIAGVGLAVYSQRTVPVAAAVLLPLCAVRCRRSSPSVTG